MSLDDRQVELFSRQILLREVGGRGQERLLAARVLLIGGGPAAETAATYLAGAGVGTLGVGGGVGVGPPGDAVGFAPLAERCPEARVVAVDAAAPIDFSEWDVTVEVGGAASTAAGGDGRRRGRARLGSVGVRILTDGGVTLVSVPSTSGGCVACHEARGPGAAAGAADVDGRGIEADGRTGLLEGDPATTIGAMLAGDMAALAACGFVLGLDPAPAVHALRLPPGAPAFAATTFVRRRPCPRGCDP